MVTDTRARPRAPVKRLPLNVALKRSIAGTAASIALLFAVLASRMNAGDDPALGAGTKSSQETPSLTQAQESAPLAGTIQTAPNPVPVQTSVS